MGNDIEIEMKSLDHLNKQLRNLTPIQIIRWVIDQNQKAIITTNFGPYSGSLLHAVTQVKPDIDVIWCDTGYNTRATYKYADFLIQNWNLNIDIFVPKMSTAFRDVLMGIPQIEDKEHKKFTEDVKLEPFNRAMEKHKPHFWFSNIRRGQTAFRDTLDILSLGRDGIIKVSPFYYLNDGDLDQYMQENTIPNEHNYFDPTKAISNRECGLHLG